MREHIFKLIDTFTDGSDFYEYNGHLWLIFTDEKKWVFELEDNGTLWYNYYFFKDCFKYISLDVIENQKYITEWVENTIQNGVKYTLDAIHSFGRPVENTIQNGVKDTIGACVKNNQTVENTIQNGVKETLYVPTMKPIGIEYVIQNGVKETKPDPTGNPSIVKDIIKNGVI